ncbi:lytic polysaccharide monooxygenase [Myriangium duriaei CBS 260.36]|uniref:Lytic polysaccharide monooxygenase n=1 Tax=Myriangium duriaei CBS 260.36 TaxID=1168546 RepID=A0A9P4J576_9PEZI|nr:lytic polysaccharide monooxygenase [Myriangium duriaei CBS 260.36]
MKNAASLSAVFAFATSVSAHLFISSPSPIPGSAPKDPLDASGSNFPCHGVSLPGSGGTSMAVGSSQLLAFDTGNGANTAVHGGGSCQISITYETDAQKIKDPSNWKVLYSILGGCPTNSPLNLGGTWSGPSGSYTGAVDCSDPSSNGYDCINQFNFTIPQGVKNGQATLAWTWFNNVGNREMYMNCVAVDITGGASDASQMSGLPNMFVANLASVGGGTCHTTEQQNVQFPNPGQYVTTKKFSTKIAVASAKDYPLVVPSGCGNVVNNPGAGGSATYPATNAPATTAPATTAPVAATTMATSTSTAPIAATTGTKTTAVPQKANPTGGAVVPTGSPAQGSCPAGSVSCNGANSIICIDNLHFGICDTNGCAVSQSVADGTMCIGNAITWATTGKVRRHIAKHMRHAGKHA